MNSSCSVSLPILATVSDFNFSHFGAWHLTYISLITNDVLLMMSLFLKFLLDIHVSSEKYLFKLSCSFKKLDGVISLLV